MHRERVSGRREPQYTGIVGRDVGYSRSCSFGAPMGRYRLFVGVEAPTTHNGRYMSASGVVKIARHGGEYNPA